MIILVIYLVVLFVVGLVGWIVDHPQPDRHGDRADPETKLAAERCAEKTNPICASGACFVGRFGCCDRRYCDAVDRSLLDRGIRLPRPWRHGLPFMGDDGCTVPAHLRPICALYACWTLDLGRLPAGYEVTTEQAAQFLLDHKRVSGQDEFTAALYVATTGVGATAWTVPGNYSSALLPAVPYKRGHVALPMARS